MGITSEARDRPSQRSTAPHRAVAVAVLTTVAAILFTLVTGVAFLVTLFLFDVTVTDVPSFVGLTAAGQAGFLVVAYAVARGRRMVIPVTAPNARQVAYGVAGAVIALAVSLSLSGLLAVLGLLPESAIERVAVDDPALFLWLGALSVVLVAPAEEFLFRGVVQGTLREAFGPAGAVAGASLLFGSIHLANFTGQPEAVVAGALLIAAGGVVLGTLYEVTGNLTVPIVAHALYNVIVSVGSFLLV